MNALGILALLVYTFGAYAYGAVLLLAIQEFGARGWAGQARSSKPPGVPRQATEAELIGGAMLALGFAWFVVNVVIAILQLGPRADHTFVQLLSAYLAFLYPPLIMHVTYAEHAADRPPDGERPFDGAQGRPSAGWRRTLWVAYVLILAIPIWATLALARLVPATDWLVNAIFGIGLPVSFIAASVYSVAMSKRYGRPAVTPRERLGDRAMNMMFGITVLVFIGLLAIAFAAFTNDARPGAVLGRIVELTAKSLPLAFLFVGAYFESRYEFFDVLVKRGLSVFVTLGLLWVFFSFRILTHVNDTALPWVYAVTLLPVALALPWIHGRISSILDRRWLGRRFTIVDAVKHVIATLRSATTEPQLVQLAEQALGDIFSAPVAIRLDAVGDAAPAFEVLQEVPITTAAGVRGSILMGPRLSEAPYFSEDVALLSSIADVFASVLDNLHLQARKREQEQLAQDLSLQASRSELKALRAQINPHFLFNALNAIAGLIHRNPAGADRTIEQLADVFRYALRGAESEWAALDDELEFVRAYLEVERARFGERLQVDVRVHNGARGARVPTMMVQTLVENAVKHGLAELRGAAIVRVDARCDSGRLTVSVMDNGPGFTQKATSTVGAEPRAGGYGLANIRQRLTGYFGADGVLAIDRDDERGLTVVSVSMPALSSVEGPAGSAT
jgi:signal transduction histidine kinase